MDNTKALNLPAGFLDTEERCGYTVSSKQKKIWAVQLDLLYQLLNVCKKHDIRIIAYCGTILGAVRHKGYIPWDDDIDVALTRTEFEKLLKVAPQEFNEPYFFQTALSDEEYFLGYARLRNSDTTGIITENNTLNYNNGIYIDVFVIDSYTHSEKKLHSQLTIRKLLLLLLDTYHPHIRYNHKVVNALSKFLHYTFCKIVPYKSIVSLYNKNLSKYNKIEGRLSLMTHELPLLKKYWCHVSDLDNIIEVPFENIMIPIPKNYDEVLNNMYGNYMEFPPVEKRGIWHEGQLIFEPEIPYKDYITKHKDEI